MRSVAIKSEAKQASAVIVRTRDLLGKRTQIVNAIADCRLLRRRVMGQMQRRRTQCLLSLQGQLERIRAVLLISHVSQVSPFKNRTALRVNNVELGKPGRWRPNVWPYPGASSLGFDARRGLKDHPTDKPTAMIDDALLDLSNRGDIVIDPFLGSGSPLIVELYLLYVYVIALIRAHDTQSSGFSSRPARRSMYWPRAGHGKRRPGSAPSALGRFAFAWTRFGSFSAAGRDAGPVDPFWVFLAPGHFAAKTPAGECWIVLDFLDSLVLI